MKIKYDMVFFKLNKNGLMPINNYFFLSFFSPIQLSCIPNIIKDFECHFLIAKKLYCVLLYATKLTSEFTLKNHCQVLITMCHNQGVLIKTMSTDRLCLKDAVGRSSQTTLLTQLLEWSGTDSHTWDRQSEKRSGPPTAPNAVCQNGLPQAGKQSVSEECHVSERARALSAATGHWATVRMKLM